jgi:hypothetical protein
MSIGTIAFTINAGTAANLSVTSYQSSCSQTPEAVEQTTEAPSSYYLLANYPNPFNPNTLIHFAIPKPGQVKISVYDLHGSLVRTLLDKYTVAGGYNISFEGSGLSSGIYFVRLNSGQKTLVGKMVLIR